MPSSFVGLAGCVQAEADIPTTADYAAQSQSGKAGQAGHACGMEEFNETFSLILIAIQFVY